MAVSVSLQPKPGQGRMVVTVSDPDADLDPATAVERDDGTGYAERRMALVLDQARTKVWADYEAPLDRTVSYRVVGTAATATGLLASEGRTWWKPLPYPALSMPVNIASFFQDGVSVSETVDVFPLGARSPVTVSGARRMLAGTVALTTLTAQEADRMADGLRRSPVVLLQPPGGRDQHYMTVREVRYKRARMLNADHVVWEMDCQLRDAPVVVWAYPATASWSTYTSAGATWNDWAAGTWLDVLLGGV